MPHRTATDNTCSPATVKSSFYRPELDALRFFAFMMVFFRHAPFLKIPGFGLLHNVGPYGVSIFFLLSAYLIGSLLLREREKTGTIDIKAFFVRRVLRIWPLYFVVIFLGYMTGEVFPQLHISLQALPYMLLLGGNFWVAKAGWALGTLIPLWSLSIEEQFYLVVPSLMKFGGPIALTVLSSVSVLTAYLALGWFGFHHADNTAIWVSSLVEFQFFGAGILLAVYFQKRRWEASIPTRLALFFLGLSLMAVAETLCRLQLPIHVSTTHMILGFAGVLSGCVGIFLSVLNVPLRIPSTFVYLGRISFGLYVFHEFPLALLYHPGVIASRRVFIEAHPAVVLVTCLSLAIALAAVSFEFFEKPILRYKERFAIVSSGREIAASQSKS